MVRLWHSSDNWIHLGQFLGWSPNNSLNLLGMCAPVVEAAKTGGGLWCLLGVPVSFSNGRMNKLKKANYIHINTHITELFILAKTGTNPNVWKPRKRCINLYVEYSQPSEIMMPKTTIHHEKSRDKH